LWKIFREKKSDPVAAWAVKSASSASVGNMLKLLQCLPGIPVLPDQLDCEPWLLNCANGTLDLRTGKLRAHPRADFITNLPSPPFDPDAPSYHWDRFLEAIFDGQQPLIDFACRLFGYCVTGDVREQLLLIFWGDGGNGKSTLLTAVMEAMGGDYALK